MAIESPGESDTRLDMGALWAAVGRRLPRVLLVTAVLLGITYAALLLVPKSYESTASILVEGTGQIPDSTISSQIELVKSRDTLLPVVRSLELAKLAEFNGGEGTGFLAGLLKGAVSPADPESVALAALGQRLTVARQHESNLINVTVRSTDPELASRLANAIAEANVARHREVSPGDGTDTSMPLDQRIALLRQRVDEAATRIADFRIANDLYVPASTGSTLLDQQMAQVSAQISAATERRDAAQSRAKLIRGLLAAGQSIDGVDDVRNSVTIQQLAQQKAQLVSQRAQLLATLLPSHPNVTAVAAQIGAVDQQIGVEGRRVADALESEAQIEATLLGSLNENLAGITAKQAEATRKSVQLDALDRESKADQALLASYMSRYGDDASSTKALTDLRVMNSAVPATSPAAPKVPLILGAVGFVALALQLGGILLGELLPGRALDEPGRRLTAEEEDLEEEFILRGGFPPEPGAEADLDERLEAVANETAAVMAPETDEEPELAAGEPEPAADWHGGLSLRTWFSKRTAPGEDVLATDEPPLASAIEPRLEAEPEAALADIAGAGAELAAAAELMKAGVSRADSAAAAAGANAQRVANLSADLILGRARVVIFASLDGVEAADELQGRLTGDALKRGLSVARVDAGSGRTSAAPGITDLAAEVASFGDVVQGSSVEGLADVPWGRLSTLQRQSSKPSTLIEALADLFEVVLVDAGCVDADSSLPIFAGLEARLVLVAPAGASHDRIESAWHEVAGLGYRQIEVLTPTLARAEVA